MPGCGMPVLLFCFPDRPLMLLRSAAAQQVSWKQSTLPLAEGFSATENL